MSNENNTLSLFVYIVRAGHNNIIDISQNVSLIVAKNNDEAINSVRNQHFAGSPITIEQKGYISMDRIIELFQGNLITKTEGKKNLHKEIIEGMVRDVDVFAKTKIGKKHLLLALNKMLEFIK